MKAAHTRQHILSLGRGVLHRATVELPAHLCERDHFLSSRTIFFEVPIEAAYKERGKNAAAHLLELLASLWLTDPDTLDGLVYKVFSADELMQQGLSADEEVRLLENGCGNDGVGPERITYKRRIEGVDILTTPIVATRINELLDRIEYLYLTEGSLSRYKTV